VHSTEHVQTGKANEIYVAKTANSIKRNGSRFLDAAEPETLRFTPANATAPE